MTTPPDASADAKAADRQSEPARPEYTKPRLRRYDQIEQVKPYGPSERRAG